MKAIVRKITKMDKKDSFGNTSFIIDFDNGDSGFYVSKNENQTKFVPEQEAEYNIEKKTGKTGKDYFKISTPQSEFKPGGRPQVEPRIQMISFAMSYTKDLLIAGKAADIEKTFNTIYNLMISKL